MRKARFTVFKMTQAVRSVISKEKTQKQVCNEMNISRQTYSKWQKTYGMDISYSLQQKDDEWMKQRIASIALMALRELDKDGKIIIRKLIQRLVNNYRISEVDACEWLGFDYEEYGYKARSEVVDDVEIKKLVAWLCSNSLVSSEKNCIRLIKTRNAKYQTKQIRRIYSTYVSKINKPTIEQQNHYDEFVNQLSANWKISPKHFPKNSICVCNIYKVKGKVNHFRRNPPIHVVCFSDYDTSQPVNCYIDDFIGRSWKCFDAMEHLIKESGLPSKMYIQKSWGGNTTFIKWLAEKKKTKLKIFKEDDWMQDDNIMKIEDSIFKNILIGNECFDLSQFESAAYLWKTGQVID